MLYANSAITMAANTHLSFPFTFLLNKPYKYLKWSKSILVFWYHYGSRISVFPPSIDGLVGSTNLSVAPHITLSIKFLALQFALRTHHIDYKRILKTSRCIFVFVEVKSTRRIQIGLVWPREFVYSRLERHESVTARTSIVFTSSRRCSRLRPSTKPPASRRRGWYTCVK